MKKILIICFSDLYRDPRPNRQIKALSKEYEVTAIGYAPPKVEGVRFIQYIGEFNKFKDNLMLKLGQFEQVYWQPKMKLLKEQLLKEKFDLIIANDLNTLPLAVEVAQGAKVIFDDHECAFRHFEDMFYWNFFLKDSIKYFCDKYIPRVNAMMTVCDSIAEEYYKIYGVKPEVVTNATSYYDLQPSPIDEKIRIVHHGVAHSTRRIDTLIEIMDYLDDRFLLDLILVGLPENIKKYHKLAKKNKKIKMLPPIKRENLVEFTNKYDIGIHLVKEKPSFSNKIALPNKMFEYIQARLVIAINDLPEMEKIVKQYNNGLVMRGYKAKELAEQLNKLSKEDVIKFKQNSCKAAQELTAENNITLIQNMVKELLD